MAETVSFLLKINDNGTFKKVEVDAESLRNAVQHVKEETDRLNNSIVNWSQASQAIDLLQQAFVQLQGVVQDVSAAYSQQEIAEAKLANNMRNTMGAREEDIQSIKDLCSAQQQLGVIGDEVQLAGAQELATYLNQKSSLEQLIPVMNDMLAQQYGLEASQESAAQIASMLGKVMDGQVGALSRYGYSFDEAQEKVLKFGTEEERAAVLAEVVESSVGGMNAALAQTDSGRQQQLANTLGDIKEQLGGFVQGIAPLVAISSQFVIVAAGAGKCVTTIKALAAAFHLASVKSAILAVHERVQSVAQSLLARSSLTATAGTWALNAAVAALYATLTMGLSVVIGAIVGLFTSMGDEAEDAAGKEDLLKESTDALKDTMSNAKAEMDLELLSLKDLIAAHGDTGKKVDELNRKYGEALGYHRTASEWYDTLISQSKAYCMQLGYEAQAKVLASQIAAKEVERENLVRQKQMAESQYWDDKGNLHYGYEQMAGGRNAYDELTRKIGEMDAGLVKLRGSYDFAINKMGEARREMQKAASAAGSMVDNVAVTDMTLKELNDALTKVKDSIGNLKPTETAEIERQKNLKKALEDRIAVMNRLTGMEQKQQRGTGTSKTGTAKPADKQPVADPSTYVEVSDALSIYEKRLREADAADTELIKTLTESIRLLKDRKTAIESQWHEAQRPAELTTLEEIDDEIRYQQGLYRRASAERAADIDREIARLNSLRTAFENQSHAALRTDEIKTMQQLNSELAWYENRLDTATATERADINAQIAMLKELKQAWEDVENGTPTIGAPKTPAGPLVKGSDEDKRQSYDNAQQKVFRIQQDVEIGLTDKDDAEKRLKEINDQLAQLGLAPIEVEIKTKKMKEAEERMKAATDSVNALGSSLSSLGSAIEVPALDVMGVMAQAIATMVQGYATASSQATSMGPWGWMAFAATGLAQLSAMVSSVKNMAQFADGGIAYGPAIGLFGEYSNAAHNPEVVAPLDKLRSLMGTDGGVGGKVEFRMKGRVLRGVLERENNHRRRS